MSLIERWRRRFGPHRYEAVIVGGASGNVTRLTFVRFRTEEAAQAWVAQMNRDQAATYGTHFEYREIE